MTEPSDIPRSPTGRIPQWVLDEKLGVVPDTSWRGSAAGPPPRAPRPPRRRRLLTVLPVAVALLAVAAALTVAVRTGAVGGGRPLVGAAPDRPSAGHEEADRPLGTPPAAPRSSAYGFLLTQRGSRNPVAYDPCRPVHYVVARKGAPANGAALVAAATARLSAATGLRFVDDGGTDEAASPRRSAYQPERYGDRWAPVLVAWQSQQENADFAGDTIGEAVSQPYSATGKPDVYVTGQVLLDSAKLGKLLANARGRALALAVVLHELGHLAGLAHVGDRGQLMFPEATGTVFGYENGDLAGLARLGAGACAPWL